jgi:predicted RNA-binding Zn-ribbon protein involved in translation (DUF1610 family)
MDIKKTVSIIIIIGSLAIAGVMTWRTISRNSTAIPELKGEKTLLKCTDPACGNVFEMPKNKYYKDLQEKAALGASASLLTCPKCGKDTAYRAVKCKKCGTVFLYNPRPGIYEDKCSNCGFSEMEEAVKKGSSTQQK